MDERELLTMLINPYYAVELAPELRGSHPPLVSREQWVRANVRLLEELGPEAWLEHLLSVLETGKLAGDD